MDHASSRVVPIVPNDLLPTKATGATPPPPLTIPGAAELHAGRASAPARRSFWRHVASTFQNGLPVHVGLPLRGA
jgi:hypothetical protein